MVAIPPLLRAAIAIRASRRFGLQQLYEYEVIGKHKLAVNPQF